MPFATTSTASGQGSLAVGSLQSLTEIAAHIITPADFATLVGASPVRRSYRQAWYGVGFTPSAGPLAGVFLPTWWRYLEIETEDFMFPAGALPLADTLYFDVHAGGVMYFELDW